MQGLPTNLLTQKVAASAVKGDAKSPAHAMAAVNGNVAIGSPELQGEAAKAEVKGSFADFFSGLIGLEGKGEAATDKIEKLPTEMAEEVKAQASAESKLDALLKIKGQDQNQNKNIENTVLTNEQALSPEVLKNIDQLLVKSPEAMVTEKVATTSSDLDQLLKALKAEKSEVNVDGEVVALKESKHLKATPEVASKLGLSSEDFVSHMGVKNTKSEKSAVKPEIEGAVFDPKELVQKQVNSSMKSYAQKQNLLDSGLIKNTNDLAFKETKSKASSDELKTPDMKIGADLSHLKDQFIAPMNNKQESAPQMESQNAGKVLDLSKVNTSNTTEIIKRISDYVQQNQVGNSNSMDLTVKHDSLGEFKIQVNKPMDPRSTQMDMQITTTTAEGHEFFVKNEIGLMKNLSQAGIQLSDLRIVSGGESMSFTQSDSRQSGHNQGQTPKEFMSFESGNFSQGSERRRELWQEARANQQRYGA